MRRPRNGHRRRGDARRPADSPHAGEVGKVTKRGSRPLDWLVLVGIFTLGFLLGQAQNVARAQGRIDAVSNVVQTLSSPVARVTGDFAEGTGDFFFGLFSARRLTEENRRLQARLDAVSLYGEQSERLQREIDSLRSLIALQPAAGKRKVAADIIGYIPGDRRITLSVGSADGVRPNMPVVSAAGLVGIVQMVSSHRSQAVLMTSRSKDRKVGAIVLNRNPSPMGLLQGANASTLVLEFQDQTAPVQVGDTVVTAGASEYIPRGVPVGKVIQVEDDEAFGVRRAIVDPFASIGELREVIVLQ